MLIKLLFKIIIVIFFIQFFSCSNNVTDSNDGQLGSRNYIWTIDTISSGSIQTYLTSIWGSSYNNAFICGYDANNSKNIYRFNGDSWLPVSGIPSTPFLKSYSAISGIDSNYFILVGSAGFINSKPPPNFLDSGLVVKFENGKWDVNYLNNSYGLYSLDIVSKNNIWVGDRTSNLLHFNNNEWRKFSFEKKLFFNGMVALNSNDIYATAHSEEISGNNFRILDYLLYYQGTDWTIIDSNVTSNNYNRISFPTLIKNINGQLYGSGEIGIVKKIGDSWKIIGEGLHGQINGTGENNIFLGNQDFGVMHYNGKDWYRFEGLPYLKYSGIVVFNDAVFLLATDGIKSFVVRGVLQL